MKSSPLILWIALGAGASLATAAPLLLQGQSRPGQTRQERFQPQSAPVFEGPAGRFTITGAPLAADGTLSEAPTGFDNLTNGFLDQGPDFATITKLTVVSAGSFNDSRFTFEEVEGIADGLGPTYNAQSCRECHQNVVTGSGSQITEQRTGRLKDGVFFESLGGSLIQSRATAPEIVEHVAVDDPIRTFRITTSALGDGYVECIANATFEAIRQAQPPGMRGGILLVPVLEGDGSARVGRFGWKSQHASLISFSADAYLNEIGITNPLFPDENTSSGVFVGFGTPYDPVPDPEDDGSDLLAFSSFMRSTKAPPRGESTPAVLAGEKVFQRIGCAVCHVPAIATAAPGIVIDGGAFTVPAALGNKIIHPYGDFLLHDVGTGDGIPFLPTAEYAWTEHEMRTAPLWGLRARNRLMHDGLSFTLPAAIQRHGGQALEVTRRFNALPPAEVTELLAFLGSL